MEMVSLPGLLCQGSVFHYKMNSGRDIVITSDILYIFENERIRLKRNRSVLLREISHQWLVQVEEARPWDSCDLHAVYRSNVTRVWWCQTCVCILSIFPRCVPCLCSGEGKRPAATASGGCGPGCGHHAEELQQGRRAWGKARGTGQESWCAVKECKYEPSERSRVFGFYRNYL